MLRLNDIRGQRGVVLLLGRLLASGRLPHALLFEGPPGSGRRTTARAIAAAALCHAPVGGDACGACLSCRAIADHAHPDLVELPNDHEPVPDALLEIARDGGDGGVLTAAGQLIPLPWADWIANQSGESAMLGHGRVFLIPGVERLKREAANRLLKALEEPPPNVRFLMTTANAAMVLSTIRSRAQRLRLQALASDDVAAILTQLERDPRSAAIGLRETTLAPAPLAPLVNLAMQGYDAAAIAEVAAALPSSPGSAAEQAGVTVAADQRRTLRAWLIATAHALRPALRGSAPGIAAERIQTVLDLIRDLDRNMAPRLVIEALACARPGR
jgi:hypothetical protein